MDETGMNSWQIWLPIFGYIATIAAAFLGAFFAYRGAVAAAAKQVEAAESTFRRNQEAEQGHRRRVAQNLAIKYCIEITNYLLQITANCQWILSTIEDDNYGLYNDACQKIDEYIKNSPGIVENIKQKLFDIPGFESDIIFEYCNYWGTEVINKLHAIYAVAKVVYCEEKKEDDIVFDEEYVEKIIRNENYPLAVLVKEFNKYIKSIVKYTESFEIILIIIRDSRRKANLDFAPITEVDFMKRLNDAKTQWNAWRDDIYGILHDADESGAQTTKNV